ncbi:hypothetical protein [Paenibacillus sp. YYML68]|uniref:hypothetical protein n=1 Tax=Paenibacillus sp. YYML68 TaxID=2909250 RepID=UPI0024922924|nr:hypothetical protein [Paenibacillus sp. YYML68]
MTHTHPNDHALQHYMNNQYPELEAWRIHRHLHGCRLCKERLAALIDVELMLDELPIVRAPEQLEDRIMQHLREDEAAVVESTKRSSRTQATSTRRKRHARPELVNGFVAITATYLFISSGVIGAIASFNEGRLQYGIQVGTLQLQQAVETISRQFLS